MGWKGLLLVLIVTPTTLWFATWIGKKLGLDRNLALLIGSGTAICGASAVAPVIDGDEKDSTFAIATVTISGTISMFLYPVIYNVFHLLNLLYAVWTGSSTHEVAQVVAAGFTAGGQAEQFATLVKLTRVLLVIPIAMIIGSWQMCGQKDEIS
ncbi:putative sulfate exporter family transporter [Tepidibacillus marianensis]|uniref:YeiH family protein n=1 Tax=Tepidibacillus marianensis TaxID=3131995 RepID=UPI0030D17AAC